MTAFGEAPLTGMVFVVTGEFPSIGSRYYITSRLCALGAVVKSGVSKKVTYLLAGFEPGTTKVNRAIDLKIPSLDKAWLEGLFARNGIACVEDEFYPEDAE